MIAAALVAQAVTPVDGPPVDWAALAPMLILLGGALVLLLFSVLLPRPATAWFAASTFALALVAEVWSIFLWFDVQDHGPRSLMGGALGLDGFSVFFMILVCAVILVVVPLGHGYLRRHGLDRAELYGLLLLASVGGIVLASANDLIVLFLGLETMSLSLYILAGIDLRRADSQEAALKYFVLGSFSSAFLLYGIALVYGATGSTGMADIATFLETNVLADSALLYVGFALLLVGLGFKVAAAPFHAWAPDVYQGSPAPVTGFMASMVKAVAFGALLRVFVLTLPTYRTDWRPVLWILAVLTLVVGAVLAVVQTDVKRMLAYSSINHAGWILVAVQVASPEGTAAALFYILSYAVLVLGTFGVIALVARKAGERQTIDDYRGLARTDPWLAFALLVFLLAQAGVPLTTGFLSKFLVIGAAADDGQWALAVIAALSGVVAAYVYLRLVLSMYAGTGEEAEGVDDHDGALEDRRRPRPRVAVGALAGITLTVLAGYTLVAGILPEEVIEFTRDAVPVLVASGR